MKCLFFYLFYQIQFDELLFVLGRREYKTFVFCFVRFFQGSQRVVGRCGRYVFGLEFIGKDIGLERDRDMFIDIQQGIGRVRVIFCCFRGLEQVEELFYCSILGDWLVFKGENLDSQCLGKWEVFGLVLGRGLEQVVWFLSYFLRLGFF